MGYILAAVIGIAVVVAEHFLGSLKRCAFGGILPLLFAIFGGWCFASYKIPVNDESIFHFVLMLLIFLSIWAEARENRKKKQEKELEKMEAYDLKDQSSQHL